MNQPTQQYVVVINDKIFKDDNGSAILLTASSKDEAAQMFADSVWGAWDCWEVLPTAAPEKALVTGFEEIEEATE